jgi:hypothetical protein
VRSMKGLTGAVALTMLLSACGAAPECSGAACTTGGGPGGSGGGKAGGSGGGGGGSAAGGGVGTAGGAAGGAGGGAAGLSVNQYIVEVEAAACKRYIRCGLYYATEQGCFDTNAHSRVFVAAFWAVEKASIAAGRIVYDGVKGQACLDFIANQWSCTSESLGAGTPCDGEFVGKVADSGACYVPDDCSASSYCSAKDPVCPGTCQPRKQIGATAAAVEECVKGATLYNSKCAQRVAQGASCAPTGGSTYDQLCAENNFCNTSKICEVRHLVGASCLKNPECRVGLNCVQGFCKAPLTVGQVCPYGSPDICFYDLHCDRPSKAASGTCATYGSSGSACFDPGYCKPPLTCVGADTSTTLGTKGSCTQPPSIGNACKTDVYLQCGTDAYCSATSGTTGTCTARIAFGQSCAGKSEACPYTGSCLNDVCRRAYCAAP